MASSSSQNLLDEAFDDRFDEIFDQRFGQAFEKLVIGGDEDVRERWSWKAWSLSTPKVYSSYRVLAYGTAADAVDEYLRLGETTTRSCVENFVERIIYLFGYEYLRRPTPDDL
uniref:Uncharacterized protein n=1 Tax=Brassica oleracea var. oleracea TaxID=109376 RepID=A0A0D3CFV4_BRAOL